MASEPLTELVLTVPEPYGSLLVEEVRCRTTLGVLTQLLLEAERYVVIAAPFLQTSQGLSAEPLSRAVRTALARGVNVDVVSIEASLGTLDTAQLSQGAAGLLRLLRPGLGADGTWRLGSHAKFCLADGRYAYVGSANLTGPGLLSSIEMGVLVCGEVAAKVAEFWRYALDMGLFVLAD